MIKLAIGYSSKLNVAYQNIILDEKYKYYFPSAYMDLTIDLNNSTWNDLQFVSVNEYNEVIGYLGAHIDRTINSISSLKLLSFKGTGFSDFHNDIIEFIQMLFNKYNFDKINWSVVVGNPVEKSYDVLCHHCNGHIVGTFKNHTRLPDNSLCDMKYYEILKSDFIASRTQ